MAHPYRTTHGKQIANLLASMEDFQRRADTAGALADLIGAFRKVHKATGVTFGYFLPPSRVAPARRVLSQTLGKKVRIDAGSPYALFSELEGLQADISELRDQATAREDQVREYLATNPPPPELKEKDPAFYQTLKRYL